MINKLKSFLKNLFNFTNSEKNQSNLKYVDQKKIIVQKKKVIEQVLRDRINFPNEIFDSDENLNQIFEKIDKILPFQIVDIDIDYPDDIEKILKNLIVQTTKNIRDLEKEWAREIFEDLDTTFYFQVVCKDSKELQDFLSKYNLVLHYDHFIYLEDLLQAFEEYFKQKYNIEYKTKTDK